MDACLQSINDLSDILECRFKLLLTLNKRDNQTRFGDNRATCAGTIYKSFCRDCAVLNGQARAPQSFVKMAQGYI